jgi:hypothetical protein
MLSVMLWHFWQQWQVIMLLHVHAVAAALTDHLRGAVDVDLIQASFLHDGPMAQALSEWVSE